MRKMKDSGIEWIGEIPTDWEIIRFKYLHNGLNTGEAIGKEYWTLEDNDTIFYTAGLIPIKTNYNDFPLWKYTTENDLLLARNGTPYVYFPVTGACYTDHIIRAKMKENTNRKFIQYSLSQSISNVVVNSVSIATWSASIWNEQFIPFPPIDEQQAIASHLDSKCTQIDSLIANVQQQIEKLKAYKQSLITETVTKGLNPDAPMKDSGVEWIGEIPKHWTIAKIKNGVTKVGSGKTPLGGAETYSSEGVLFLRSQNIYDEGINLDSPTYITNTTDEEMKSTRVKPYDVLLNITGGSIGRCCIFPPELEKANVNQHVSIIRVIDSIFTPDYMHYYWNSNIGKMSISLYQTGGNREGMSADAIKNSPIMVIPIQEQKVISDFLDSKCSQINKLISLKQQKIEKLQQYKKSLIYEYVTGKREV